MSTLKKISHIKYYKHAHFKQKVQKYLCLKLRPSSLLITNNYLQQLPKTIESIYHQCFTLSTCSYLIILNNPVVLSTQLPSKLTPCISGRLNYLSKLFTQLSWHLYVAQQRTISHHTLHRNHKYTEGYHISMQSQLRIV